MKEREKKEKAIAKKKALEEKRRLKEEAKMTKQFNEFDKHAIANHKLNFPDAELIENKLNKKEKDRTNIQLIPNDVFEKYNSFSPPAFSVIPFPLITKGT